MAARGVVRLWTFVYNCTIITYGMFLEVDTDQCMTIQRYKQPDPRVSHRIHRLCRRCNRHRTISFMLRTGTKGADSL